LIICRPFWIKRRSVGDAGIKADAVIAYLTINEKI
jgi:hypothetical protein